MTTEKNSLFAKYLKERESLETIEDSISFATYQISGENIYIKDIFVERDHRKTNAASNLADIICRIGKTSGCKYLIGSVCPTANGSTDSMKVLLSYGMKLFKSFDNLIYFIKEI